MKKIMNGVAPRFLSLVIVSIWGCYVPTSVQAQTSTPAKASTGKYQRPVLFNGEVQAKDAFQVIVPSSNVNPVPVRFYLPEGTVVKAGDVIMRVENQAESDLDRVELELVQTRERGARELADLDVKAIEAERALVTAKANLAKAKIDAGLPRSQISALDYDKYQGELERTVRDLSVRQQGFDSAKNAISRKLEDNELAAKKLQIQIAYAKLQQIKSEVKAGRDGVLIHGYDAWTGKRLDEGGQASIGTAAGQIMGDGKVNVVAWVLEADRPFLQLEQTLAVRFDAIPHSLTQGKITRIAGAPETKAIWGNGRYFKVEIAIPENHGLSLQHGMSAAIELPGTTTATVREVGLKATSTHQVTNGVEKDAAKTAPAPTELTIEGEVLSRLSTSIKPPQIQRVWQYNLVMLAPEGKQVKQGEIVAIFEANEVKTRLDGQRNTMKEKQRTIEKLVLDHAEAAKAAELAVAEAKSNAEKAARKASLPKELVKRIDYDKLVIERELFAQLANLAVQQRDAQVRARTAEFRGVKSEMATLQQTIDTLERGIKGLQVLAPRAGTVIHLNNYDGEKIAVGSKVYMGGMAATLADPEKIFVLAKVPEAQVSLVKLGQVVQLTVPGSSDVLSAKVHKMGPIFHGKSSSQPIIVRDIELEFDTLPKNVKPGTAVQVKFASAAKNGGAK